MSTMIPTPPPVKLDKNNNLNKSQETQKQDPKKSTQKNILFFAFLMILRSIRISNQSAQIQAKKLKQNAQQQLDMVNEEAQYKFVNLTKNDFTINSHKEKIVKQGDLESVEIKNKKIQADRQTIGGKINVLGQESNIDQTNMNQIIDTSQQSTQEGGNITNVELQVSNRIAQA